MHIDNDKAADWLRKLLDGVENSNNDAERVVTQAMAAGTMLKALERLVETWRDHGAPGWVCMHEAIDAADAAISRAHGDIK